MSSIANYLIQGPAGLTMGFNAVDANDLEVDGVVVATQGGGGGNPSTWSQYPATQDVAMAGLAITNIASLGLNNIIQINSNGSKQLVLTDGVHTGLVYDSYFNPVSGGGGVPTLQQVVAAGAESSGGITVGSLSTPAINDVSTIHVSTVTGVSAITGTSLAITGLSTINGAAYPPSVAGVTRALTVITSNATQPVSPGSTYTVLWYLANSTRSFGTSPFAWNAGEGLITNTSSNTLLVDVNCYVQWSASTQADIQVTSYGSVIGDGTLFGLNEVNVTTSGTGSTTNNVAFSVIIAPSSSMSIKAAHTNTGQNINIVGAVLWLSSTVVA